jgi:hypothetical protein
MRDEGMGEGNGRGEEWITEAGDEQLYRGLIT